FLRLGDDDAQPEGDGLISRLVEAGEDEVAPARHEAPASPALSKGPDEASLESLLAAAHPPPPPTPPPPRRTTPPAPPPPHPPRPPLRSRRLREGLVRPQGRLAAPGRGHQRHRLAPGRRRRPAILGA